MKETKIDLSQYHNVFGRKHDQDIVVLSMDIVRKMAATFSW